MSSSQSRRRQNVLAGEEKQAQFEVKVRMRFVGVGWVGAGWLGTGLGLGWIIH
jgi:hypothetical protein